MIGQLNNLSLYFSPGLPTPLELIGISFIAAPTLTIDSSIANLSAERYAAENYPHRDTGIRLFDQTTAGSSLTLQYAIPTTSFGSRITAIPGYSINGIVPVTDYPWGFDVLDTPISVIGMHISKANSWCPIIKPGTLWRQHTVLATEPVSSWLRTSGLSTGDSVVLIYSVPEIAYTTQSTGLGLAFPIDPSRYRQIKQTVLPAGPNTINYTGDIYRIDEVLVNGSKRYTGTLAYTGVSSGGYIIAMDKTLKIITLNDNLNADDYVELKYTTYNDYYIYSGYRDNTGAWYAFDANPEYGHYITSDITGVLGDSSVALSDHITIYALPCAYMKYSNFTPTPNGTTLGTLKLEFVRAVDWSETHFIRHAITGDGLIENLQLKEGGSTTSTYGQASFGVNYYDEIGTFITDIYSTKYPSIVPLGRIALTAPAAVGSIATADIRQRGGGVPEDFPMIAVETSATGIDTIKSFWDLGNFEGTSVNEGGVAQININKNLLKTDPTSTDPTTFTSTEIYDFIKAETLPGVDTIVSYQ